MTEQSWETLPVAVKDIARRTENEGTILRSIEQSLAGGIAMPDSSRNELIQERDRTIRSLQALALALTTN
jgi:hypothetical protein